MELLIIATVVTLLTWSVTNEEITKRIRSTLLNVHNNYLENTTYDRFLVDLKYSAFSYRMRVKTVLQYSMRYILGKLAYIPTCYFCFSLWVSLGGYLLLAPPEALSGDFGNISRGVDVFLVWAASNVLGTAYQGARLMLKRLNAAASVDEILRFEREIHLARMAEAAKSGLVDTSAEQGTYDQLFGQKQRR